MLLVIALSTLLASAAGQGCPSNVCNSYFANALGGPVDCCNHNFESNPRCTWGGTPVSFTLSGTCTAGGKQYKVLRPSNSQGPPGSSGCRCSNPSTTVSPTPSIKMTVELKAKVGQDIKGFDLGCDGASTCMICSGLQGLQAACASRPQCVAFTFEPAQNCGYLKTAAGPMTSRSGWVVYSRM